MKIGFTGTQLGMTMEQHDKLESLLTDNLVQTDLFYPNEFHSGDCIGADEQAHMLAQRIGFYTVGHPPILKAKRAFCHYDESRAPKPYLVRNSEMVRESDWVIATPKEFEEQVRSGTWATVRDARHLKKRIIIVWPDGTVSQEQFTKRTA